VILEFLMAKQLEKHERLLSMKEVLRIYNQKMMNLEKEISKYLESLKKV
jgi:hypothetical protein